MVPRYSVCWLKVGAVWFSETGRGPHCTKVCWNIEAMCNETLGVERGANRVCVDVKIG
jgi:hypothetical protein